MSPWAEKFPGRGIFIGGTYQGIVPGRLEHVEPGTRRNFASEFCGNEPQIKVEFVDGQTARVFLPEIVIKSEEGERTLAVEIKGKNFSITRRHVDVKGEESGTGKQETIFEAVYLKEK